MLWGVAYFAAIYVAEGVLGHGITRALAANGIGGVLDPRALPHARVRRERLQSAVSILIFGLGLIVPWWMVGQGLASADAVIEAGLAREAHRR